MQIEVRVEAMIKSVLKACFKVILGLVAVRLCILFAMSGPGGVSIASTKDIMEYRDAGMQSLEVISQQLFR